MEQEAARTIATVDAGHFRHVVGHLATGVSVITTTVDGADFGMTASSVTSLSVDPPLMLACINNAMPTAAAVGAAKRYAVNILDETHGELARQFAVASADKFHGVPLVRGDGGAPLLRDALAHIECEVSEQIVGGTHTIFIGRVVAATARPGQPLTYFRGGFGRFEFARDDNVYRKIREQVLSRRYSPGDVIVLPELAALFDADDSTAFYALTRLAADGLVRRDPDRGYVVTAFDIRTSDETFDARLAIELGVIELIIDRVSEAEIAELRRRFERMAKLLENDHFVDFGAYLDANYLFHEHIVSLAHNSLLSTTFGSLSIKNVMTRSFGSTTQSSQRFIEVQRQLIEAIERRDADSARRAASSYCEQAKERAREILRLNGGQV